MAKRRRIRRRRNTKHYLRNSYKIRVYKGERRINLSKPSKFTHIALPLTPPLPNHLYAYLTQTQFISYDSSSKMVQLSPEQFLSYAGPFFLSIAQHQITPSRTPALISLNLRSIYKVNLWYYPSNRITNWHYDSHDNFLYVLKGKKIIHLKPPHSLKCQGVFSPNSNQSTQLHAPWDIRVVVKEGECVFIPFGWFHKVYSVGTPTVAVNFWGNSVDEIPGELRKVYLKSLVGLVAESSLRDIVDEQLRKSEGLRSRRRQLMEADIEGLRGMNLHTPLDFEMLADRLEKGYDQSLSQIWTILNYEEFSQIRIRSRKIAFQHYLSSIM